jgi:hypothetical protein
LRSNNVFCKKNGQSVCFPKDDSEIPTYQGQGWECSNEFTDDYYQYQICPFESSYCGNGVQDYDSAATINVAGLPFGKVCNFRLYAKCDAPVFKVESSSTTTFNLTYVEYTSQKQAGLSADKKSGTSSILQDFQDS